MFANKPVLHRGATLLPPSKLYLSTLTWKKKRQGPPRATSFLEILLLVNRKGMSLKTIWLVKLLYCRAHSKLMHVQRDRDNPSL